MMMTLEAGSLPSGFRLLSSEPGRAVDSGFSFVADALLLGVATVGSDPGSWRNSPEDDLLRVGGSD